MAPGRRIGIERPDGREPECTVVVMDEQRGRGKFLGLLASAAALLKFAPLLKVAVLAGKFKSLLLMIASLGAYTMVWGWRYAVGFMVLLFLHELGHVIELRRQGVRASLPMFIPFLGAFVAVKERQADVGAEARSALAGPALGLVASAAVAYMSGDSLLLGAVAYTGFFLNLLNLAPMLPLDGGRVAGALSPRAWLAGMVLAVVLLVYIPSPVLLLVLLFGAVETASRWRSRNQEKEYYELAPSVRRRIGLGYALCVIAALIGMEITHVDPAQLR
jgi:Zn-dependent protease